MVFPIILNVGDLDGTYGFRIRGTQFNEEQFRDDGYGAADIIGDVNGDGLDDLLFTFAGYTVGANFDAGVAFVVYGSSAGFPAEFDIDDLNGVNGFRIEGDPLGLRFGVSADAIGDVNGDGRTDFAIRSSQGDGDPDFESVIHVFYGRDSNFPTVMSVTDADFEVRINRSGEGSFGLLFDPGDVNSGDINGDGLPDLLVGGGEYGPGYAIFGKPGGMGDFDLDALDGSNGFAFGSPEFEYHEDTNSYTAAIVGDINGDGIDDISVGGETYDFETATNNQFTYVLFGGAAVGGSGVVDLSLVDGANGFLFGGAGQQDQPSNNWIAGAGDVNGDGFDDLITGGENFPGGGRVFVIYGSDVGFPAQFSGSELDGENGFAIVSSIPSISFLPFAVEGPGDINGDGYDDVIFSNVIFGENLRESDPFYVIYGGPDLPAVLDLIDLDGENGFTVESDVPFSSFGLHIGSGGDLNGDGLPDFVITAPHAGVENSEGGFEEPFGTVSVIFGRAEVDVILGTPGNDPNLAGTPGDDTLDGLAGNDTISGLAGADTLIGGLGNDTLDGGDNPEGPTGQGDVMLGGEGDDTYHVDSRLDLVDEGSYFPAYGFGGFDTIISTTDFYWDVASVGERLIVAEDAVDIGGDGVTIVGSVFDNEMIGHSGTDLMFGRGGSDTYIAGDGVDFMSLSMLGLTESNAYAGVNGVNTVVVEKRTTGANSYDIVFEFESGKDKLNVSDYGFASTAAAFATGVNDGASNSYFVLGDGLDYLYMVGLELSDLSANDFIV